MTPAEPTNAKRSLLDALADPTIPGWERIDPQPAPNLGRGDVWLDVIAECGGWVPRTLVLDMGRRREQGIERYDTPLQYDNGRDAAADAYQEALDLVVYSRQARAPWWLRWGAVFLAWAWLRRCR